MNRTFTQGHALVIGVGGDLPNTVNDAKGIASLLTDPTRCAYPHEQVSVLTGVQATRTVILSELDSLAKSTTAQSTVILYFSGHGCKITMSDEHYFLIPSDYDPNHFYETTIDGREFTHKLEAIPAQKLVVFLDCCHAGGIIAIKSTEKAITKAPLPLETKSFLTDGRGRVLIASSREDEFSLAGKPYSAFTLALIEAFSGVGAARSDGHVRIADIALHAREVVPTRTKQQQHPILHFEQADNFVIAYYAAGDSQPKGMPFRERVETEPFPGAWTLGQQSSSLDDLQANTALSTHPFPGKLDYTGALEQLRRLLKQYAPESLSDLLVYENRLMENLIRERRYGTTEAVRAERTEIVGWLNDLTQRTRLGVSFNELTMGIFHEKYPTLY